MFQALWAGTSAETYCVLVDVRGFICVSVRTDVFCGAGSICCHEMHPMWCRVLNRIAE